MVKITPSCTRRGSFHSKLVPGRNTGNRTNQFQLTLLILVEKNDWLRRSHQKTTGCAPQICPEPVVAIPLKEQI